MAGWRRANLVRLAVSGVLSAEALGGGVSCWNDVYSMRSYNSKDIILINARCGYATFVDIA